MPASLARPPLGRPLSHSHHDSEPIMADNSWANEPSYPAQLPPPPPVAHRVWVLDCASCGTFLTNRGMKAVLLLRPNVALFSSDALPVNCSANTFHSDSQRPPAACNSPTRTCECLTQTLCCHGCGAAIGYMIVVPCTRCTSSMATSSRSTNGHRFVFHSGEIVGTERYYIPSEPGVLPYEPIPRLPLPASMPVASQILREFPQRRDYADWRSGQQESPSSTRYLPTPPLEPAFSSPHFAPNPEMPSLQDVSDSDSEESDIDSDSDNGSMPALHSPRAAAPEHANITALRRFYDQGSHDGGTRAGGDVFYGPEAPRKLKAGEPLFWHNLVRHGEIPGVTNDPRARKGFEPIVDLHVPEDDDEPILFGR